MQRVTIILTVTLALGMGTASGQTTFRLGLRGGFNFAQTTIDPASNRADGRLAAYATNKDALLSWQAGAVLEIGRGNFALQPALLFSQKGEESQSSAFIYNEGFNTSNITRYNWLELPLNLVYTLPGGHGLQVFAGPYGALGIGGSQQRTYFTYYTAQRQTTDTKESVRYGSGSYNHRFDAGVNFGIGYRLGPVQVQAGYSLGLVNLHQASSSPEVLFAPTVPSQYPYSYHDYQADAAYNRVLQLTGTYFLTL